MANDEYDIFECCERNDVEGLKTFIRSDININNVKDECGDTPLHTAASHNSKECLQILIQLGADPNIKNNNGSTPLHYDALYNSKECLQLLLEVGADPNIKNDAGETFLHRVRDDQLRKETEEYVNALSTVNIKEPSF